MLRSLSVEMLWKNLRHENDWLIKYFSICGMPSMTIIYFDTWKTKMDKECDCGYKWQSPNNIQLKTATRMLKPTTKLTSYMPLRFQVDGRSGTITSIPPVASTNCNLPEYVEIWKVNACLDKLKCVVSSKLYLTRHFVVN